MTCEKTKCAEFRLKAARMGNCVELVVEDNGSGIDAEEMPFLFDRLHRIDKARSDNNGETGLGLAIVKALVTAMGGSISAVSRPGEGTAFTISFP
jgi:signal transduction histidine kinase